ncbi:bifunctional riboflavin kinase/FAD synthetase [Desulforhopalus singaporensis]|uniref:Riboflavin biosynthesis protein n=1 Tax=Desulforhopalus singaporensis TaxID=91360 RepID=A0A1H0R867_9BACT|nr:bifunctional riboflavin kinase/FAD synthetase [Desulforhopalus singaporensis]SDP25684.1 FMN adenylyltransferase [Desulforhopalus singaporensis]
MKIYRSPDEINHPFTNSCVTIGNFDGVHTGHQQLFATVVEKTKTTKGTSIAITFDPHPLQVLMPDGIKLISTYAQKEELIEKAGIDVLLVIPFTREFAKTTAESFVNDLLVEKLGVKELVVGYDYAFGKGRSGNIEFLRKQGEIFNFPVTVVDAHYIEGELVSSTKIREMVREGQMAKTRIFLGRNYQIRGTVQVGKQRGGKVIGFPTANLKFNEEDLVPKHGVYVTQVVYGGRCYGGILNIGYNPTFDEKQLVAETHIFDFNEDIYGKPLKVNLLKFLRSERKFAGPEELAEQIIKDVAVAKQVLQEHAVELVMSCSDQTE